MDPTDLMSMLLKSQEEQERKAQIMEECGYTEEHSREINELGEKYPEWANLYKETLDGFQSTNISLVYAFLRVAPESLMRHTIASHKISMRCVEHQMEEIAKERFEKKEEEPLYEEQSRVKKVGSVKD